MAQILTDLCCMTSAYFFDEFGYLDMCKPSLRPGLQLGATTNQNSAAVKMKL